MPPSRHPVIVFALAVAVGFVLGVFVLGPGPPRVSRPAHHYPPKVDLPRSAPESQEGVEIDQSTRPPVQTTVATGVEEVLTERRAAPVLPLVWHEPTGGNPVVQTTVKRCLQNGMQPKCLVENLVIRSPTSFTSCGASGDAVPSPVFLADGQRQPLIQYHQYRGHRVERVPNACRCDFIVERPTVFLFRMSGHSTYHLWENNLGPFYATLQDFKDLAAGLNDPTKLLVAFWDTKPTTGPKAPHLLDRLLRTFTDRPLINASWISSVLASSAGGLSSPPAVCFRQAILGVSANSFPHRALVSQMLRNVLGRGVPGSRPLPVAPSVIFVSRNHHSVVRGRKIANEAEVVAAVNATLLARTGRGLRVLHFETMSHREQVEVASGSHVMLSPHGGGVANCIWMPPGSMVVEFVAPVGRTLLSMYRSMCGKSGVGHVGFTAEPDPADAGISLANPRLFSNMVVPPARIVEHLEAALQKYAIAQKKRSAEM